MVFVHIATSLGLGGISLFWLWGDEQELQALDQRVGRNYNRNAPLQPGTVTYGALALPSQAFAGEDDMYANGVVDEVLLSCPESGRRIVGAHGGTASAVAILHAYLAFGALESACPPDWWVRAGGMQTGADSIQKVADQMLPACRTPQQAALVLQARQRLPLLAAAAQTAALPPDERARLQSSWRFAAGFLRPRKVCLFGAPNAGKSSLLNRLAGDEKALVSPEAGTTRDAVRAWIDLEGYLVSLVDTAGLRRGAGEVEREAQRRAQAEWADADVLVWVVDASVPAQPALESGLARELSCVSARTGIVVLNKADLPPATQTEHVASLVPDWPVFATVATSRSADLSPLRAALVSALGGYWDGTTVTLTEEQGCLFTDNAE